MGKSSTSGIGAKKAAGIAAAVLCCIGATITTTSAAAADDAAARATSVRCDAGGRVEFSPGLLPMPQDVTASVTSTRHSCTDFSGNGIARASFEGVFGARLSCGLGAGTGTPGSARIGWEYENGTTAESAAEVTLTGQTLNQGNFTGTVEDGPLAGQSVEGNFAVDLASGGIGCAQGAPTGGLKTAKFTGGFTIVE
ncbi:hypothetical protein [Saccharopolyspora sp. NPDC002578]